jgi:ATP-dependent helicase/nuclease subunit B
MKTLIRSFSVDQRLNAASVFLHGFADREVLVVASTRMAADELVRGICAQQGAVFGVHRFTSAQLAIEAATKRLSEDRKTILAGVAVDALAARAVHACRQRGELRWFDSVARTPGFFRALASTLLELRLNRIEGERLKQSGTSGEDLAALLNEFDSNLNQTGVADLAAIYRTAVDAIRNGEFPISTFPTLLLDVAPISLLEQDFIGALTDQSSEVMATAHARDDESVGILAKILGVPPKIIEAAAELNALERLRRHVFQIENPPAGSTDATVDFISATDESRECVEIARAIIAAAGSGTPFDRVAVLLRNPDLYQPLLEDAFHRAGIRAFFTHGTRRPNPAGRALLALLACVAEKLSASRFSEYLSIGQVPRLEEQLEALSGRPWVAAQGELFPELPSLPIEAAESDSPEDTESPVISGTLRTPGRWERLIVDAAVIGGYDRWVRRLGGLENELQKQINELGADDEHVRLRLERDLAHLSTLRRFALPIVHFLDRSPGSTTWSEWLDWLEQLTMIAIRQPEAVLTALAELRPMGNVSPVGLDEVLEALSERLTFLRTEPAERRYGKVFVGTIPEASGLSFDIVFLPGLGEDIFPRKIFEDPLLLDVQRAEIGPQLAIQDVRFRRERMLLHAAAGAARSRLWLSYPRMDLGQGRGRSPSFYALDVLRAITGKIPDLRIIQQRATETSQSQESQGLTQESQESQESLKGWPATRHAAVAIDDAEYDLAVIGDAVRKPSADERRGLGRYLMEVNPSLARSLRGRWSRWEHRWSPSDGLILDAKDKALELLQQYRLISRPYSATALQQFAACPYKFALYSIYRLRAREEIVELERMDALTRGSLFHAVQFHLLSRLKSLGMLPITAANHSAVAGIADQVLEEIADGYREELAPAIPRIWDAEVEEMRWDLRGWIRQVAFASDEFAASEWKPRWFELAFGLLPDSERDPESSADPVDLPNGMHLRGSIDMIEERGEHIRITDHKTGRAPSEPLQFVGRGEVLQPLLYAEAAEILVRKVPDQSRLFYCTETGGYRLIEIPVNEESRAAIQRVVNLVDHSIASGFLPAAPRSKACQYCDYHVVCGPYEESRVQRKPEDSLVTLKELREIL